MRHCYNITITLKECQISYPQPIGPNINKTLLKTYFLDIFDIIKYILDIKGHI
jgi:hypothetical protein